MPLTEEIKQVVERLGKQLGADPALQEFLSLEEQTHRDPKVVDLENQLSLKFQKLNEDQQNGEALDRFALDEYRKLKNQVQEHPLIAARDYQLEIVKTLFVPIAAHITTALGFDFTKFAC